MKSMDAPGDSSAVPRIVVVGAGNWGRNHVRVLRGMGALAAVVDGAAATRDAISASSPEVGVFADIGALVRSGMRVDGAVIATPASTHEAMAIEALQHDWHILVEKPVAQSLAGVERIHQLASRKGRVFAVGHLLLHHPHLREAKRLLDAGRIGKPLYAYGQRLNLGKIRTDEDVVSSLAPHDLSILHYLTSAAVESAGVWEMTVVKKARPLSDVAFVSLGLVGGLRAHFHFSWLDPFKRREFVVVGDRGMMVFDDMSPDEKLRIFDKMVSPPDTHDFDEFRRAIEVRDSGYEVVAAPTAEPLALQAQDFLACIRKGGTPVAGYESAAAVARAMELIWAARR